MKRYGYFAVGLLAITAIASIAVLGFDVSFAAAHSNPLIHTAEFGALLGADASKELKAVFDRIGESFKAFKEAHDEEIKGIKKGFEDVVTKDKLKIVQDALDKGVEAKAALDAAIEAEKKHVDDLEKKLNKFGLSNTEDGRSALELKSFNQLLAGEAAERKMAYTPLDAKGYDEYKAAYGAFLRKNEKMLSQEETKTLSLGSDPDGGYLVTPDISGRIIKKVFETSPVRQFASAQPIGTEALEGIEDLGEAGAGYAGETAQGTDTTTPQVGKWRIPVWNLDTEPKATQNLLDDANVDVEGWLAGKVGDKLGRFENAEFVAGATNKIRGFMAGGYTFTSDSGAGVTWGQIGYIGTGVNGDFAAAPSGDKLIDLVGLLKNAYLANARWITRRSVITKIRKFKDGMGNYMWQPSFIAGQPETIMGYPVARMEDVPALATGSISLAFGDLNQAYQIVDRQGIRVLRDPYTSKPFVKFYTTKRTGGGMLNFEAIKVMKFS